MARALAINRHHVPAKLVGSVLCALCAGAIAVAAPHFIVESSAWKDGAPIPKPFTCDGGDALPPLRIAGVPKGTAALALVVDDPDAPSGLFTHLLAWNLPAATERLEGRLPEGAVVGTNDFGRAGWGGPCPPHGKPHRYRFHVHALKAPLSLEPGAGRAAFDKALAGNTLGEAILVGTYKRGRSAMGDYPTEID